MSARPMNLRRVPVNAYCTHYAAAAEPSLTRTTEAQDVLPCGTLTGHYYTRVVSAFRPVGRVGRGGDVTSSRETVFAMRCRDVTVAEGTISIGNVFVLYTSPLFRRRAIAAWCGGGHNGPASRHHCHRDKRTVSGNHRNIILL